MSDDSVDARKRNDDGDNEEFDLTLCLSPPSQRPEKNLQPPSGEYPPLAFSVSPAASQSWVRLLVSRPAVKEAPPAGAIFFPQTPTAAVVGSAHASAFSDGSAVPVRQQHHLTSQPSTTPPRNPLASHYSGEINLTENEEKIFRRLLEVVRHFKMEVELRVAGGWVRDKLLGRECNDIDIALDKMLGRVFCEKINELLALEGEKTQGVGVIQSNPDQSKHLETARMRIYDTWIDFVNLRSETYAENSRIPTMMFGTAKEDAYRRDLTINSLFYNINNNSVEDFTKRGVEDLKRGIIITPLPPKATFLDDPLRVLRAIRFGARFGFTLDDDLKEAAADEEVKTAIANKISRERIGHEIDSMMSNNQPVKAITYLCDLQLVWHVFTLPHNSEPTVKEGTDRLCVEYMDAAWSLLHSLGHSIFNDDHHRLCLYGALLLPLRKLIYKDKKGKEVPVASYIIRNSLKLKASDAETVVSLHSALDKFISLITFLEMGGTSIMTEMDLTNDYLDVSHASKKRILAGLFLRQLKDFWPVALLMSTLLYPEVDHLEGFLAKNFQLDPAREMYRRVHETITIELDLDKVWEMKPLLKGDDIMDALELKSGPQIREWQERLIKWQLAHPRGEKEEALDWVRGLHTKHAKLN